MFRVWRFTDLPAGSLTCLSCRIPYQRKHSFTECLALIRSKGASIHRCLLRHITFPKLFLLRSCKSSLVNIFRFVAGNFCGNFGREEKSVHDHHRKIIFWELFWPQRKTFKVGGGYKIPVKTRKNISTTEIFPRWPPFFWQR